MRSARRIEQEGGWGNDEEQLAEEEASISNGIYGGAKAASRHPDDETDAQAQSTQKSITEFRHASCPS